MSDDPRWQDSVAPLVGRIRDEIVASRDGRITFARFMERALTEPGLGYYASTELRPTREGDFLTAPELHAVFGRCLARFVAGAWEAAGSPHGYRVHEYGAGRGALRESVQRGLMTDRPTLAASLLWRSVDLPGRGDAGPSDAPPDLIIANEYLDALPVHRVIARDTLREIYVGWQDGWFSELEAELSDPALADQLADSGIELAGGQRAEVCPAAPAWMRQVASTARLVLVIDYAHVADELYGPRRMAGSLLTYRRHHVSDDPFMAVGETDITAHVDISALQRAARVAGLAEVGTTSQARFLAELGLGQLLADMGRDPGTSMQAYLAARSAVARLLDPRHLGGFRVMAWAAPELTQAVAALPGFGTGP